MSPAPLEPFGVALARARRDQLAAAHLPLAERRAQRLAPRIGLPADEAHSAALMGLAQAIDRYRPALGEFAPFACRWIDGAIRNAARDWRWRRRGEAQAGRELVADSDAVLGLIPDELRTDELAEQRTDIGRALASLDRDERRVILLHGKLGHTFPAVALMLGEDEDRCKYLWRRGLGKMRVRLGATLAAA